MDKTFAYCELSKAQYELLMKEPKPEDHFKVFSVEARKYSETTCVLHIKLGNNGGKGYVGYCLDTEYIKKNIQTYATAKRFLIGQALILDECGLLDSDYYTH